jgi:peptide/nickel transport system permease protein
MRNYWLEVFTRCRKRPLGMISGGVILLFVAVALWAPFLASSKPICVVWQDRFYFPLFRYLLSSSFFTKKLDIFFNALGILAFVFPISFLFPKKYKSAFRAFLYAGACFLFVYFGFFHVIDPAISKKKNEEKQKALLKGPLSWDEELSFMTAYGKLNLVVDQIITPLQAENEEKRKWLEDEVKNVSFILFPLIRPYHWEDDVGFDLPKSVPFWQACRLSGKDLMAALIFGSRISLLVGFLSCALSLAIALPLGLFSGFYGGTKDLVVCHLVEVWESMPAFFMLLLLVTVLGTKSLLVIIGVIALFGWTGIFRFVRAEVFRQRQLTYVDAARSIGLSDGQILARHILPNALAAVIALLPFDIMAAITRESAISFLGLGEEQSCSWGVLMDEGRQAFPAESVLLWPPALVLSVLLIAIALLGDALQKAMDSES